MLSASLPIDDLPRPSHGHSATQRIAQALAEAGINAHASLYDEALALAREGRLAKACERLGMLLCLDPTDADAALLHAKILAQREKWQESLAYLDTAVANGALPPPGLREKIELALRQQIDDVESQRARVAAREQGEIKNLRVEAKRLRSDNASLESHVQELTQKVRIWSSVAAVAGGAAVALAIAYLAFSGSAPVAPQVEAPTVVQAEPAFELEPAPAVVPSTPTAVAPPSAPSGLPATAPSNDAPTTEARDTVKDTIAASLEVAPTPEPPATRTHTVKSGDTLGRLAKKYYGNSALWPRIAEANQDLLKGKNNLSVGMKLEIPPKK